MQADEYGAQDQRHHDHPGQLKAVFLEEIDVRRALGQVDDAAQVAEQRDFDQRANQADKQQGREARPDLLEVIGIKRQYPIRRSGRRGVAEDVDQFFKTAIKHGFFTRERALL